jgi:hypothetical protein
MDRGKTGIRIHALQTTELLAVCLSVPWLQTAKRTEPLEIDVGVHSRAARQDAMLASTCKGSGNVDRIARILETCMESVEALCFKDDLYCLRSSAELRRPRTGCKSWVLPDGVQHVLNAILSAVAASKRGPLLNRP